MTKSTLKQPKTVSISATEKGKWSKAMRRLQERGFLSHTLISSPDFEGVCGRLDVKRFAVDAPKKASFTLGEFGWKIPCLHGMPECRVFAMFSEKSFDSRLPSHCCDLSLVLLVAIKKEFAIYELVASADHGSGWRTLSLLTPERRRYEWEIVLPVATPEHGALTQLTAENCKMTIQNPRLGDVVQFLQLLISTYAPDVQLQVPPSTMKQELEEILKNTATS